MIWKKFLRAWLTREISDQKKNLILNLTKIFVNLLRFHFFKNLKNMETNILKWIPFVHYSFIEKKPAQKLNMCNKTLSNSLKEEMQNKLSPLSKPTSFYMMNIFWDCSFNKNNCKNTFLAFPVLNSHLLNLERKSMPEGIRVWYWEKTAVVISQLRQNRNNLLHT